MRRWEQTIQRGNLAVQHLLSWFRIRIASHAKLRMHPPLLRRPSKIFFLKKNKKKRIFVTQNCVFPLFE